MKHPLTYAAVALMILGAIGSPARADGTPAPPGPTPTPTPAPGPRPAISIYAIKVATVLKEIPIEQCKKADGPVGPGKVHVIISPTGAVASTAIVAPSPYAGTAVGGCIAARYRGARFSPPPNNASFETDYAFELK